MAMLYDDHDLSHDFEDDEDTRLERLQTIKAAVDTVRTLACIGLHVKLDS